MTKNILIAFPQGGIVPGSVLGKKDDQVCAAMEPVLVPDAYGRHLIEDRFAVEATSANKSQKKSVTGKGAQQKDSDELAAAKNAVVEAEQLLASSGDDAATKAEAETMLKAAQDALAALQG